MGRDQICAAALVVCALLACKKREAQSEQPVAVASAPPKMPKTAVPDLAGRLGAIMRKPIDFSEGVDKTGQKTISFRLKPLPGIEYAEFVGYRGEEKAWKFDLEITECETIDELGVEAAQISKPNGALGFTWFRIKGGPLEGALAERNFSSVGAVQCSIRVATPPYWEHEGITVPTE